MPYTPIPDELKTFEEIAIEDLEQCTNAQEAVNVTKRVIAKFGLVNFAKKFEIFMRKNS